MEIICLKKCFTRVNIKGKYITFRLKLHKLLAYCSQLLFLFFSSWLVFTLVRKKKASHGTHGKFTMNLRDKFSRGKPDKVFYESNVLAEGNFQMVKCHVSNLNSRRHVFGRIMHITHVGITMTGWTPCPKQALLLNRRAPLFFWPIKGVTC